MEKDYLRLTDQQLIKNICNGDKVAECELINRYYIAIRTTVRFQLGVNYSEWEDVLQEVFIRLLDLFRKGKFDPERGTTVKSFINGVVRNLVREFWRKEKRSGLQAAASIPTDSVPSMPHIDALLTEQEGYLRLERAEQDRFLKQCLEELKEKYREVIILRYYQELSMRKVGERINKKEQQVIDLHRFALKKMRECFKKRLS